MYKLLTPGLLTTSETVKNAMLIDHCTWDQEYKEITQWIRKKLLDLAQVSEHQILQAHVITQLIEENPSISALAMVHSETTSGILNNLEEIAAVTQERDLLFIVDAMSSFVGYRFV